MSNWVTRDRQVVWHPFTPLTDSEQNLVVTSAKGIYLHTEDGRKIIDGISSWWVNIHGHSHPVIAEAIYHQALALEHVIFAGFTHPPAIQLAENLLEILPKNQSKIFYSDNGSTAVEVALKMAIQYWYNLGLPKKKIIALKGAYHGDTFGAMSVGERGTFTSAFHDHLFPVEYLEFPEDVDEDQLLTQLQNAVQHKDVAAFIYEPLIQGAAGMRIYSKELLDKMLRLARAHNVILIADEVFTGFGRTGVYFASDYLSILPDIIALSKGLTGGTMALGVTSCTADIQNAFASPDALKTFFHGHSFTANPIACAAAIASLKLLRDGETWTSIKKISSLQFQFSERIKNHSAVEKSKSLGTILSIEITTKGETNYFNSLRKEIYRHFLQRNILLRPLGNVLYFLPSYVFTETEIKLVHQEIEMFLNRLGK
ncbi:MAG: adenosylmethionine--8-amino-7-oxononanoate transaminase [Bacteroidota bacterium]